jgi:hypothetical protein
MEEVELSKRRGSIMSKVVQLYFTDREVEDLKKYVQEFASLHNNDDQWTIEDNEAMITLATRMIWILEDKLDIKTNLLIPQ